MPAGSFSPLSLPARSSGHTRPVNHRPPWLTRDMRSHCFLGADKLMPDVDTGWPHTLGPDHMHSGSGQAKLLRAPSYQAASAGSRQALKRQTRSWPYHKN